jgi:hypothetical protein
MADIIQENREIHDKLRSIVNHLRIFDNFVNNVKNIVEKKLYEKQNKITLTLIRPPIGLSLVAHLGSTRTPG